MPSAQRAFRGLTRKVAARASRADEGTSARWEFGEREPTGGFRASLTRFLNECRGEAERMGSGLNRLEGKCNGASC
jgi:hypothetical protein